MKSICFLEELQNAIVELRKTETRRLVDPLACHHLIRPRYEVGEVIYIKEPYVDDIDPDRVFYKYDPADIQALQDLGYGEYLDKPRFWRNKLFMPARLARYFLRITARHGERLQDISEEAARREGVQRHSDIPNAYVHYAPSLHFSAEQLKDGAPYCRTARASFQTLMEMLEGPKIWEKNPFVWVYKFELVSELAAFERRHYKLKQHNDMNFGK